MFGKDAQKYFNSQGDSGSDTDRRLTAIGQPHSWDARWPITVINRGLIKVSLPKIEANVFGAIKQRGDISLPAPEFYYSYSLCTGRFQSRLRLV